MSMTDEGHGQDRILQMVGDSEDDTDIPGRKLNDTVLHQKKTKIKEEERVKREKRLS